jgi:undecaprenyl-diphosphatase
MNHRETLRRAARGTSRWVLPAGVLTGATLAVAALLDGVRERSDLAGYDPLVTSGFVAERQPLLTVAAQGATFVGSTVSVAVLTLSVLAWTLWRRRWSAAALVTVAMAGAAALTVAVKHVVGRARPPASVVVGPVDSGFAFPSAHTLNSTVFFGLLAAIMIARTRSTAGRAGIAIAWATTSVAIGLSRIYLGYHWMTDVMAGWSIGLAVLALTALAWTALAGRGRPTSTTAAWGV